MYSSLTGNSSGQGAHPFPLSTAGLTPPVTGPETQVQAQPKRTSPHQICRETWDCTPRQQEEALHRVPSRDGAARSCGGTGHFGQDYWQCFWSTSFPLVWHIAKGSLQQLAITSLQQSEMLFSSNTVVLLLSLINENDQATIQYINFLIFFLNFTGPRSPIFYFS